MATKDTALRILKVKRTRTHIFIDYTSDAEERTLKSRDNPLPTFVKAFEALPPLVCEIVGLPAEYTAKLTVTGVTLCDSGGNEHVMLTAKKELTDNNRPFNINTPLRLTDQPQEEGTYSPPLSEKQVALVQSVIDEASAYIKGDRAQGQIAFEEGESDADEEEGEESTPEPSEGKQLPFPNTDTGKPKTKRKSGAAK